MNNPTTDDTTANAGLAIPWRDLWNGDLSLTERIIAEDFVAHAAPLTGSGDSEIRGREALNQWVSGINTLLPDLNFTIEVGPITTDEYMIIRWKAQGHYGGGFPAASPTPSAERSHSPAPTP